MIIQGTNAPIIFTFSDPMDEILDIEISLYNDRVEMKHWSINDVTIEGPTITAPLTQEESIKFPAGKCSLEIKWMDAEGRVNFANNISNTIVSRHDKTIMEGEK